MFRNVTGAQEAVVYRQSEDSLLLNERKSFKLIKDVQSDNIAQTYPLLKTNWYNERQKLIENLKILEKRRGFSQEIKRIKNLIECFNQLIEHGEITKNCQILNDDMKNNLQPSSETYMLTKKPLDNQIIRLPRHISKTKTHISNPFKRISSKIFHIHTSNERLQHQTDSQMNTRDENPDEVTDNNEHSIPSLSNENFSSGIQFYVVAEQFRNQLDQTPRKKT